MNTSPAVLSVRRLQVHYPLVPSWPWQPGGTVRAVNDLQFDLRPGEALGVLGESGSGKSTLARSLTGLQARTAGDIVLRGREVARLDEAGWKAVRRDIQVVSADHGVSPGDTAMASVEGPLLYLYPELDADARAIRVTAALEHMGVPVEAAERPSKELTAAQRTKIAFARALATEPAVLVCDEPFSGLDAADAEEIIGLLARYREADDLALVFMSRDVEAVRKLSQRILVMYMGRLMEQASTNELFERPRHPYTRLLLAEGREDSSADQPHPADPPSGCVFRTRCDMADSLCAREVPHVRKTGASHAACHFVAAAA